jgi:hypothetical protein
MSPIVNQKNQVYALPNYLFKDHFNIFHSSPSGSSTLSLSFRFPTKTLQEFLFPLCATSPASLFRFDLIVVTLYRALISGFRRDVDIICGLLGDYMASCGNYLPTFRDNVSVPSSRVEIPRRKESVVPKRRKIITSRRRVITQKTTDYII